ncbi:hypothetical protein J6590_041458 [Homalodisca vitripennis]|nr:hypothetical protein J6590_041458 [Homalodisca vitripennis]
MVRRQARLRRSSSISPLGVTLHPALLCNLQELSMFPTSTPTDVPTLKPEFLSSGGSTRLQTTKQTELDVTVSQDVCSATGTCLTSISTSDWTFCSVYSRLLPPSSRTAR